MAFGSFAVGSKTQLALFEGALAPPPEIREDRCLGNVGQVVAFLEAR